LGQPLNAAKCFLAKIDEILLADAAENCREHPGALGLGVEPLCDEADFHSSEFQSLNDAVAVSQVSAQARCIVNQNAVELWRYGGRRSNHALEGIPVVTGPGNSGVAVDVLFGDSPAMPYRVLPALADLVVYRGRVLFLAGEACVDGANCAHWLPPIRNRRPGSVELYAVGVQQKVLLRLCGSVAAQCSRL